MKKTRFAVLLAVGLVAASGIFYAKRHPPAAGGKSTSAIGGKLAALLSKAGVQSLHLDLRTVAGTCAANGPLPDHACTPGAVFPNVTLADVCVAGYAKTVRSVSVKLKRQTYREYGFAYPQQRGAFEADHLIPLELGGSNDIANLWPEAAKPAPGFPEKDLVENYLHDEACAGNIKLASAQELSAVDWLDVYESLSPEEIRALKAEVANWSSGGR